VGGSLGVRGTDAKRATAAGHAVKRRDMEMWPLAQMGFGGPAVGLNRNGLVLRAQPRRIGYFFLFNLPKLLFNAKTILVKTKNVFKARKILKQFRKFQENS
jgi:hypothetical protein